MKTKLSQLIVLLLLAVGVQAAQAPDPASWKRYTGTVVLKVIFSSRGDVNNIRTASGLPFGLTERAIDAAKKIKVHSGSEGRKVRLNVHAARIQLQPLLTR